MLLGVHILLGLARVNEGVAMRVLNDFKVDAQKLYKRLDITLPVRRPGPA